jgi:hypothetical protein
MRSKREVFAPAVSGLPLPRVRRLLGKCPVDAESTRRRSEARFQLLRLFAGGRLALGVICKNDARRTTRFGSRRIQIAML